MSASPILAAPGCSLREVPLLVPVRMASMLRQGKHALSDRRAAVAPAAAGRSSDRGDASGRAGKSRRWSRGAAPEDPSARTRLRSGSTAKLNAMVEIAMRHS